MDPEVMEGRLLALRQALAMVLAGKSGDEVLAWLAAPPLDGQEDPGAVEDGAQVAQAAAHRERTALARETRLRRGDPPA
jgi:hypothetical protein